MALAEGTKLRSRARLRVVAALVVTGLMAPVAGVSAQSPPPTSIATFLLDGDRYTTIEAPEPGVELFPTGIDDRGRIVGEYIVERRKESAFVRDKRGRFTIVDVPGAQGTEPHRINNRGQIVGLYSDDTPIVNNSAQPHGFLLDRGELIAIDVPGAVVTSPNGINDRGQVVGQYTDADGMVHGFLWDKGRLTTFDGPDGTGASLLDINDRGQIVGANRDPIDPEIQHGFVLSGGVYTTFDAPGGPLTFPLGINNRGQIVGYGASDPAGTTLRGFLLRRGVKGPFTPIDFPGAPRTLAADINDRGQIVGAYENSDAAPDDQPSPMQMPMMMMSGGDG
jgi:probable HAF family extracellular repeat protein